MSKELKPTTKQVLGGAAVAVMAAAGPAGQALEVDLKPITDPIKQDARARRRREEDAEAMNRTRRTDRDDEPPRNDVMHAAPSLGSPTDIPEVGEHELPWIEFDERSNGSAAATRPASPARKTRRVVDRFPELRGPVRTGVAAKFPELAEDGAEQPNDQRSL